MRLVHNLAVYPSVVKLGLRHSSRPSLLSSRRDDSTSKSSKARNRASGSVLVSVVKCQAQLTSQSHRTETRISRGSPFRSPPAALKNLAVTKYIRIRRRASNSPCRCRTGVFFGPESAERHVIRRKQLFLSPSSRSCAINHGWSRPWRGVRARTKATLFPGSTNCCTLVPPWRRRPHGAGGSHIGLATRNYAP